MPRPAGSLVVHDGLAREFRQGLFAGPGCHPVLARLAQGPGEHALAAFRMKQDGVTAAEPTALEAVPDWRTLFTPQ